jgi:hypothetical protein
MDKLLIIQSVRKETHRLLLQVVVLQSLLPLLQVVVLQVAVLQLVVLQLVLLQL